MRSGNFDVEKLWTLALHGTPLVRAMALTLLDQKLDGKITVLAKRALQNKLELKKKLVSDYPGILNLRDL